MTIVNLNQFKEDKTMSNSTITTTTGDNTTAGAAERHAFWRPWYRVENGKEEHKLLVAMPGVPKNGVEVALDGDQLTITGHRTHSVPETWKPVFTEVGHRDYRLIVRLNVEVDENKISAHVEDGMLTLTMPVKEEAKPRTIAIE